MTVAVSTWLQDALPRTPGIVRSVAKREFMLTCREFFEKSFAWREVLGPIDVIANTASYAQSPVDSNTNVVGILSVEYNGRGLDRRSRMPADTDLTSSAPDSYYLSDVTTVVLYPTPTEGLVGGLTVYAALTPNLTATVLPNIADTLFRDALLDGMLGRVFSHPAKPYSNPTLAQYHLQRFRNAIGTYAARAKAGQTGSTSWQYPRFGK